MGYRRGMTYSWQNEDGEPIMDGAAWRFEQQLDLDSQGDYLADADPYFHTSDGEAPCEVNPDLCTGGDLNHLEGADAECSWCGKAWPWPFVEKDEFDYLLDDDWNSLGAENF